MNKQERKYLWITIFLIFIYLIIVEVSKKIDDVSTVATTVMAIVAAVSFWLQLKRTENLDEANFIMTLNDQFISNEQMTEVENALEIYYCQVNEHKDPSLNLVLERGHKDSQKLVNYLVYMEGLAALIRQNVMHLGVIDDLFAYRFFIAVNNPVVQEFELVPFVNYYQGCYELAEKWTKEWRKKGREIPLDKYSLCDCKKYNSGIVIRPATKEDNLYEIARCIYLTDPFIYPAAFGSDVKKASSAIKKIIESRGNLFSLDNITVAVEKDNLCGIIICNTEDIGWNSKEICEVIKNDIPNEEYFHIVSKDYFEKIVEQSMTNNVEIVACCVLPEFRKRGIGKKLLEWVSNAYPEYTKTLDVLADNSVAVKLYQKCGYEIVDQYKGFSIDAKKKPDCFRMLRKVDDKLEV